MFRDKYFRTVSCALHFSIGSGYWVKIHVYLGMTSPTDHNLAWSLHTESDSCFILVGNVCILDMSRDDAFSTKK
jgi:hypothetical protein